MNSANSINPENETLWDVAIIGGALSGSATALELLRRDPSLRVMIIESNENLDRRVGESTVEVSSYFLSKVLGLSNELNRNHLAKQGLRFIFFNEKATTLGDCSEAGPKYNVLFPGYQIDRARLDEVALQKAVERGATLIRPAKVKDFELEKGGIQTLQVKKVSGEVEEVRARWIVDASGVRALVGRKMGWIHTNGDHPIATAWSRWKGVLDWDNEALAAEAPEWSQRVYGVRNNATNHLIGKGWWAWWIPLRDGDVSIGVVYDQRICELSEADRMGERIREMVSQHPAGERLLRTATFNEGDVKFRRNISYFSDVAAQDGVALVGDALGFLDPFYSPGLDWLCYSTMATAKLIVEGKTGEGKTCLETLNRHNQAFEYSYHRWFSAIYRDKYYYMGDFEIMTLAFRLDLGLYYLGVVRRPFKGGVEELTEPSFGIKEARIPAKIIAYYNQRFVKIAQRRMKDGRWGRRNAGDNFSFFSYRLNWTLPARLVGLVFEYGWFEVREFFESRLTATVSDR